MTHHPIWLQYKAVAEAAAAEKSKLYCSLVNGWHFVQKQPADKHSLMVVSCAADALSENCNKQAGQKTKLIIRDQNMYYNT
jgi:hypothetical protein